MGSEFVEYLSSFLDKWLFWVGIVLLVLEIFKRIPGWKLPHWVESVPPKWFWGLALVCLFLSTFQVWHEEKLKAKEGAVFVRVADMYPRMTTGDDIFPVGENLAVNVWWTVTGREPAMNALVNGQIYLENDYKTETQKEVVKKFQVWWEDQIARYYKGKDGREHPPIYPDSEMKDHPQLWQTYLGPEISPADKLAIVNGEKIVFIIGAVRFQDSLGTHEAHECRWVEGHPQSEHWYASISLRECEFWVSPIDVKE